MGQNVPGKIPRTKSHLPVCAINLGLFALRKKVGLCTIIDFLQFKDRVLHRNFKQLLQETALIVKELTERSRKGFVPVPPLGSRPHLSLPDLWS